MNTLLRTLAVIAGLATGLTSVHGQSNALTLKPDFVDTLIGPYLSIQKALAADNLEEARIGAEKLNAAAADGSSVDDGSSIGILLRAGRGIVEAEAIATARGQFLELSKQMQTLVGHVGTTVKIDLYLAYCPMAFGGKGGAWMQSGKTVANPYYGSQMLRCGSVKKLRTGASDDAESHADGIHSEHAH